MNGALQYATIVSLGRVFDGTGIYTVHRMYRITEQSRHLFSREALAARKLRMSENASEWVAEFVKSAHEPTTADFRRIRSLINKHRSVYQAKIDPLRDKHFAHAGVNRHELSSLFSVAKYRDVERIVVFLNQLHEALWEMFYNGHRLRLLPMAQSSRSLVRRRLGDPRQHTTQERITSETRQFLRRLIQPKRNADGPQVSVSRSRRR